jgi:hypothetical protein
LKGAYDAMNLALQDLSTTINYSGYSYVVIIYDQVRVLDEKLDHQAGQIGFTELKSLVIGLRDQTIPLSATSGKTSVQQSKGDIGDQKHAVLKKVKDFFLSDDFLDWDEAIQVVKTHTKEMWENFIPNTCRWFVNENPTFKGWVDGTNPVLYLNGAEGVGKSHLAYRAVRTLYTKFQGDSRTLVASFFFKADDEARQSILNRLASAAWQLCLVDTKYAEQSAHALLPWDSNSLIPPENRPEVNLHFLWDTFFASRFTGSETKMLFLVLDGMDESNDEEREDFFSIISQTISLGAHIRILMTGKPAILPEIEHLRPTIVTATADQFASDINTIIRFRCNQLPFLRRFSKKVKNMITNRVMAKSDGEFSFKRLTWQDGTNLFCYVCQDSFTRSTFLNGLMRSVVRLLF